MLRAVFVRTLKAGVTYEQFKEAWVPEDMDGYLAKVSVSQCRRRPAGDHGP